jgi:hypothetical protein
MNAGLYTTVHVACFCTAMRQFYSLPSSSGHASCLLPMAMQLHTTALKQQANQHHPSANVGIDIGYVGRVVLPECVITHSSRVYSVCAAQLVLGTTQPASLIAE